MPVALVSMNVPAEIAIEVPMTEIPEWTHKLVIYFWKLPWATYDAVKAAVESTLIPAINAFEFFMGYDYLGYVLDWQKDTITLYYRQRIAPLGRKMFAPPLAAILAAIALILISVGIIIFGLAWYEGQKLAMREQLTLEQLLEEGKITPEEYAEYKEQFKKHPPAWYEAIPEAIKYAVYGGIAIALIFFLGSLLARRGGV